MSKNIKIMLADDSAFMRKILKDILEEAGYSNFIEVSTGQEAIDTFESEKPDLVLLDVVMPEVDGVAVVKEIGKKTKVLMVSAVGQDSVIQEAKGYGALGYIVKPFDKTNVIDEITKVMK